MILQKFPLITASQNPVFQDLIASIEGRGERVLVHGLKAARDLIEKSVEGEVSGQNLKPKTLIARESFRIDGSEPAKALFQMRFKDPVTRLVFSDVLFDQIDPFGVPDLIVAFDRPETPLWTMDIDQKTPSPTLVVATQNPLNLGACLRSAAAFGVKRVVSLKESASAYHAKTIRASMGHVFDLEIFRGPSIRDFATLGGESLQRLVALDMNGTAMNQFTWPKNPIFFLGEEGQGIPEQFSGLKVKIPMLSSVESLNVAVSAGIAMYDWSSKQT